MSIESISKDSSRAAIMLVTTLVSIYVVSQFLRNSIGVIAPNLAEELALSPAQVGLLSSTYFFVFAAIQIPVGMALDRFGPRLCLLIGAVITVAGCVVFAWAADPLVLILGRALMGLGTAGSLVASLAVYAGRFPPQRFATLTGLHIGIGTVGTLIATAPLAFSAATIGWRASFLMVAAFTLLAGALVAAVLRSDVPSTRSRFESLRESLGGMLTVLRTPSIGRLFLMHLAGYSTFGLIAGLWGGPYLAHIYGYDLEERGSFLLIPVLAQIVGSVLWGPLDRLVGSYKLPVLTGAGLTAATLGYLALADRLAPPLLIAWFAMFGLVSAYVPVLIAHGRALFASHQVGRGLTVLNIGTMGGTFLAQAISGFVIGFFPTAADGSYDPTAYRVVFGLQGLFIVLSCLAYFGSYDPLKRS